MDNQAIVKTEGVCGGSARLFDTRIPVWSLESARRQGLTDAEILTDFPNLTAEQLSAAWGYVEENREEIDREIEENEKS